MRTNPLRGEPRTAAAPPVLQCLTRALLGLVLFLALASSPARADEIDDEYLGILRRVHRAETLQASGRTEEALTVYREAQSALFNFKNRRPTWNNKVVAYRLDYLAQKISDLTAPPAVAEPSPATGSRPAAAEPGAPSQSSSPVKLLAAGAEPRKVLRLHPQPGDKQQLNVEVKMTMDMQLGPGQSQAMKLPAMTLPMDLTVQSVSPEGEITYEMVMGEASVADDPDTLPQIAEAMKAALNACKGLTGIGKMSDRGISRSMDIKLPADAKAETKKAVEQMRDSFSKMGTELPEQAVGVGAKWEVRMPMKSQGMNLDQTTTYELVALDGEGGTAKTTITQRAGRQKIENPAMPNLKMDLTKMTGQGSGEVIFDLSRLAPVGGQQDLVTEMAMGMDVGGQQQTMTMKMGMNVRFESK